jgi:hypothetical protein
MASNVSVSVISVNTNTFEQAPVVDYQEYFTLLSRVRRRPG